MHDDLFAITHDLVQSLPAGVSGALGVLLISVLLAWIKWKAEEGQRAKHQVDRVRAGMATYRLSLVPHCSPYPIFPSCFAVSVMINFKLGS